MYFVVSRGGKDGRHKYVRLMESYRNENGVTCGRIVKNFGRLDKLLDKDPLALEKLKKQYSDQSLAEKKLKSDLLEEELAKILAEDGREGPTVASPALNFSYYVIRKVWNDFLNVNTRIDYLQRRYFGGRYDIKTVILYLVAHKIMDPRAVIGSFHDKDNFLGDPVAKVSIFQMYKTYTFISIYKDLIFQAVNKSMDEKFGRDRATLVFYDVTNVYFESSLTDAERGKERSDFDAILQKHAMLALKSGKLDPSCFDGEGRVMWDALPEWFTAEMNANHRYLRMRGPSKEHRTDLPLVSAALVIDSNGFPMDYALYPGNASEFKTMPESIETLKSKYHIEGAVVVADRGLNSLGNLQMLLDHGLGFIVAQKTTQFDASLTEKMLDLSLYAPVDADDPDSRLYQVIPNWKKTGIPTAKGSCIECTLVLTFSEARRKRDVTLLDTWAETVEKMKEKGVRIGPRRYGWASIAEIENGNEQRVLGVNQKLLEAKKRLCGFGAIVFKDPPCTSDVPARTYSGAEIVRLYHHLNGIEDCFRAMKSNFDLRPIYFHDGVHINGHIAMCTLALIVLRIIQHILKENSIKMSVNDICNNLKNSKVNVVKRGKTDARYGLLNIESNYRKGHEHKSNDEIVEMVRKGEIASYPPNDILRACGLAPLPGLSNRHTLAKCLGTRFHRDEDAIPEVHFKLLC